MNKSTLLITGTTDFLRSPTETDNTCEEVFELTLPSKQRYTKKHGYDLLTLRSFGEDTNNIFLPNHLGFLRVLHCFKMLKYYDTVMWIDADAILTNLNYKIENFTDNNSSLCVSWDWNGKQSFSTGNFILKNTNETEELYQAFLSIGDFVVKNKHWGEEQTTFNLIYNNTELKNTIKILDHNYLNSVPSKSTLGEVWSTRPEIPYPWNEDCFLAHITGIPNNNRIEILNRVFNKFL